MFHKQYQELGITLDTREGTHKEESVGRDPIRNQFIECLSD